MKSAYLQALFKAKPALLPTFAFLTSWARNTGIIREFPTSTSLMATAEFYAFVLKMIEVHLPPISDDSFEQHDHSVMDNLFLELTDLTENLSASDTADVGKMVMAFFMRVARLRRIQSQGRYIWPPAVDSEEVVFQPAVGRHLCLEAEKAIVKLSFSRNGLALLEQVPKIRIKIVFVFTKS